MVEAERARSLGFVTVALLSSCASVTDDVPELPDGGCPSGFESVRDYGAADLDQYPDGGCLRACKTDGDCHSGDRCSVKAFFWGGDYFCNRTILVCRANADDCDFHQ